MGTPARIEGSWGVTPVPERLGVLAGLEVGLLFGNLGVSLLVIVGRAVHVPGLSLPEALLAIAGAVAGATPGVGATAGA